MLTQGRVAHADILYPSAIPFVAAHVGCLAAIATGVTWKAVALGTLLYWARIFGIGAGYHRYFSHRAFKTSRGFQFVLAFLSQTSCQNSVLWWAAKHRHHHMFSDTQDDPHSVQQHGFLHSHVGWIFDRQNREVDFVKISDLSQYPELRLLHKLELAPATALAALCFFVAGWAGFVVGFLWSTVLAYHSTFSINSLAHLYGKRRYVTGDGSRNNWILAIFTMGEGWHNNHHAYQRSARQGFRWWEIDMTFYILVVFSWLGLIWDFKTPPLAVTRNEHRLGRRTIERAAQQLADSFSSATAHLGRRASGLGIDEMTSAMN